jgi:hypothetical protein
VQQWKALIRGKTKAAKKCDDDELPGRIPFYYYSAAAAAAFEVGTTKRESSLEESRELPVSYKQTLGEDIYHINIITTPRRF